MSVNLGTRKQQNFRKEHFDQGNDTRSHTRDVGMKERVTSAATFTAVDGRMTGANGDFTNFGVGDPVLVQNSNLNNGYFTVTGVDGVNQAYLVLDPAPKNEGPLSVVVRTP